MDFFWGGGAGLNFVDFETFKKNEHLKSMFTLHE
jgi:hypothetical protein